MGQRPPARHAAGLSVTARSCGAGLADCEVHENIADRNGRSVAYSWSILHFGDVSPEYLAAPSGVDRPAADEIAAARHDSNAAEMRPPAADWRPTRSAAFPQQGADGLAIWTSEGIGCDPV